MDEIGRGTSPVDGLAIAQAVIEYIHEVVHSRTLFATHFHELEELCKKLRSLRFFHMKVIMGENSEITFLHKVTYRFSSEKR
jgi:DNA mismatch repair protein MutS